MDTKHEELTPAERKYLEHARAAESQGVRLAQYYRANGLSVYSLYNVRRRLIKKGIVARGRGGRSTASSKPERFIAVRVAPVGMGAVCRLRHPSGWLIECGSWPEVSWLRELTGERP